jgi:hypothetical protein
MDANKKHSESQKDWAKPRRRSPVSALRIFGLSVLLLDCGKEFLEVSNGRIVICNAPVFSSFDSLFPSLPSVQI